MYDFNDGGYIKFNGISSEKFNLRLMNLKTDTNNLDSIFGIKRQVEEEETNSYESQFIKIKPNKQDFTFELVKASKYDIADKFTEKETMRIKRWLCVDDGYHPLKVKGYTYDVVFINLEQSLINSIGQGSIKLTVHTSDGLKHGNWCIQDIQCKSLDKPRIEEFTANFNVGSSCSSNIIVTQVDENEGEITISNETNKSKIIINGLRYKEQAKIISKTGEIYSIQDEDNNLFSKVTVSTDKFFTINYGINRIKLEGLAKAQVTYRPNYTL